MNNQTKDSRVQESTTPPFPDKLTFRQMFDTLFNRDFMNEEEFKTVCDAAEMYANGCLKNASSGIHTSGMKWVNGDFINIVERFINEYREQELPDRNEPFHFEAEIDSGFKYFLIWLKEKNKVEESNQGERVFTLDEALAAVFHAEEIGGEPDFAERIKLRKQLIKDRFGIDLP